MKEIIFVCLLVPFMIGCFIRALLFKDPKGWIVTAVFAGISAVLILLGSKNPIPGSEMFSLLEYASVSALAGALISGIFVRINRRKSE